MDSLWCTLQDKVNIMGCTAAGRPWRHPRCPPRWPPSWILLKIQICRVIRKLQIFPARVVQCDRIKHFAGFGSILCFFFHWKMVKNTHFYSKTAWPPATYDIISRYHSNWLSPNFTKMFSRINEQLLITAYANNKCCWRNRRKTFGGGIRPLVRPRVKEAKKWAPLDRRVIARSEIQMGTGNEFLNFNLIKKWDPSHERSCKH